VIAVTSFGRCEGRTTLALALARLACGINARVGLVDGDIEHADVAQQLSLAFDQGWESWEQHTPLGEVAVVSIREQLTLLPIGPKSGSRAEPQIQQRAQTMLDVLRSHLDLVFVDAGPMYIAAHRWFRSDHPLGFDAALVIRDVRQSNVDQVDDVCCRLIQAGIQDAAIIENFQEQA
jgi:Mrp family chromosome partitioning ATPase